MDKTLISGKEAVEDKECENDTSRKVQPDDVETEQTKRDSPSRIAKPDEADEKVTERLRPDSVPEDGDNLCTVCGFSAKCPRSLKIHYARRHGRNSKNANRTVKPAEKCENMSDTSPTEIQQESHMETESAAEIKQNRTSDLNELRSARKSRGDLKFGLPQEEAIQTQGRRVSKRTPKPKMIHSCNYCGQEFWGKSHLDLHIQRYHTKDTPYTCEYMLLPSSKVEIQPHASFYSKDVIQFIFQREMFHQSIDRF